MSFTHALKWSFASELAAKAIQPVVFIVLARLLTPEDFGVMTAAMMVIAFSQIFWEAGMGKALIQRQTDIEEAANAAFFINIALGIVIAGLLYLFAQPIAQTFFQDDRVTAVLQVMTLQVLLGALSSVQTALLQKEMGFKKLFWVRFTTVSLPGLASIPLAWNGMGYWALVAGTLVGQLGQVILLWKMCGWTPAFNINSRVSFELWMFGRWVLLTGILGWFYQWMDSLVVGLYMGSHDLGLYRTGNQLVLLIYASLTAPLMQVLYSWMSRKNTMEIKNTLEDVASILAVAVIPLAFFIYLEGHFVSEIIFDSNWGGIGTVISVMALSHGLSFVLTANSEAYRANGKPQFETLPMAIGLLVFIPTYIISAAKGLDFFVYARLLVVTAFGFIVHAALARLNLNINILFFMKYIIIVFPFFVLSFFVQNLHREASGLFASILLATILFAALLVVDRHRYKRLYRTMIIKA
jgi:O-antigen/teichoic acid export membrane protein